MSELKRTQLYDIHVAAGATMVDFGGWEMPSSIPPASSPNTFTPVRCAASLMCLTWGGS